MFALVPLYGFQTKTDVSHVVRCGDLLASLAREAHIKIEVPKRLGEHRVYLRRRGAAPLAAIRGVAKAINASLVQRRDAYLVERTADDLKAIRAGRLAERERWFGPRLEKIGAYRKANVGTDALLRAFERDAEIRQEVAQGKRSAYPTTGPVQLLPAASLLEGLVARIGYSTLAAIPTGESRVCEDVPVPSASPLPKHDDLSAAYVAAMRRLNERDLAGALADRMERTGAPAFARLPENPSAARLRLLCQSSENAVTFRLEAFDRAGNRLDQAALFVGATDGLTRPDVFVQDAAKVSESQWVTLSPNARKMVEALRDGGSVLPEGFADPVAQEPLDGFVREAVAGLVEREKGPVAYDVSDLLWSLVRDCVSDGKLSLDALRKTLDTYFPSRRLVSEGITVWRPLDPEADEASRADRGALRTFARSLSVGRPPGFRATCRLFHDASPRVGALANAWWGMALSAAPSASPSLIGQAYAFLGAISEPQWNRLMAGETITAGRLGVTDDLRRLFDGGYGFTVQGDGAVPAVFTYPMELYAGGDLKATPIRLRPLREAVVRVWTQGQKEHESWSPLGVLGMFLEPSPSWFRIREGQVVTLMTREKYEAALSSLRFRNGVREGSQVALGLPRGLRIVWDIPRGVVAEPKPFVYADLPEDVRRANWEKALRDGIAEAKRPPGGAGIGGSG